MPKERYKHTGVNIEMVYKRQLIQGDTLAGEHIVHPAIGSLPLSENKRPDTVWVSESNDSKSYDNSIRPEPMTTCGTTWKFFTGKHCYTSVTTLAPLVDTL